MAAPSRSWAGGDDDRSSGGWTTVTRSGRGAPAPAPTVAEATKGVARIEIGEGDDGARRLDKYDIPVEVSGEEVPPPAEGFQEAGLAAAVLRNVAACGYENPTPVQRYSMPIALAGRDLMACAQTGSGKTAAFCLPVVSGLVAAGDGAESGAGRGGRSGYDRAARPRALVLAPTRELAAQIYEEAKKFSHQTGIRVVVAYGGTPMYEQLRNLERGADILVATPGRLVDMVERTRVSLEAIKYLVMDEADRMLDMGFEPQIRKIVDRMNMPPKSARQTMLFSATFPPEIQRLASDFLSNYIFITVGRVGSSTDLIMQKVEFVSDGDKRGHLIDLLQSQPAGMANGKQPLTLVFVETKREADTLRYWLYNQGFPATAIHGDRTQQERESALKAFKTGRTPILVATDVASRGLDVPNVAHVINYDLPKSIEDYVHRIGRTGRAGKAGAATAFFTESNHPLAKGLLELMTEAKQDVPDWLAEYAENPCYGGRGRRYGGGGGSGSRFGGRDYRRRDDYSDYSSGGGYSDCGRDGRGYSDYSSGGGGYSDSGRWGRGYSDYSSGGGGRGYSDSSGRAVRGYSDYSCRGGGGYSDRGGGSGSYRDRASAPAPPPLYYPSYPMGTSDINASGWD